VTSVLARQIKSAHHSHWHTPEFWSLKTQLESPYLHRNQYPNWISGYRGSLISKDLLNSRSL
jgi:hypothetical protein